MTERTPVQVWRLNKERLNPLSANPGSFVKMHHRQQEIASSPKPENLYKKYTKENQLPRTR